MLKAIELAGFKSFVDKTRFEFPQGVTVVVGPNGSGKSNIVDAMKWVLGSQSAKALRGKEMTDVIFNGSGSRGAQHAAEATISIDNSDRRLAFDGPEVNITRRVYRSGEGEYLINRQPCRLRDIRDLLAGTGITTEAYSIIEQGRVDAVLQSSPRDRRAIFEEAAGISRFKAKRAEAARRLERVEQNLLRLSDIVDEVESRLRSVRTQAGKARRYREYATRLEQLRTTLGVADWRVLSQKLASFQSQLDDLRRRQASCEETLQHVEREAQATDHEAEARHEARRQIEIQELEVREEIAIGQSAQDNLRARADDIQQELARLREQLRTHSSEAESSAAQLQPAIDQRQAAERELAAARDELATRTDALEAHKTALHEARAQLETHRSELAEANQAAALAEKQASTLQSQHAVARTQLDKALALAEQLNKQAALLADRLAEQQAHEAKLDANQQAAHQALEREKELHGESQRVTAKTHQKLHRLESELGRVRERAKVLQELEQRGEGYTSGVREVLHAAERDPDGPFADVRGVLADLIRVDVDTAPLLEVALGEQAQFLVLASADRLLQSLQENQRQITRRVGFLRLDTRAPATAVDRIDLSSEAGVLGRADQFVETNPEYVPLVGRLLGRVWLVDSLDTALRLSSTIGRGLGFVTSQGQLLSAEGTILVGAREATSGLLSRGGELRNCRDRVTELEKQISRLGEQYQRQKADTDERERAVAERAAALAEATRKLDDSRHHTAAAREKLEQANQQYAAATQEKSHCADGQQQLEKQLADVRSRQASYREQAASLQSALDAAHELIPSLEAKLSAEQQSMADCQVQVAKGEHAVEACQRRLDGIEREREQRNARLAELRELVASRDDDLQETQRRLLVSNQEVGKCLLRKESLIEQLHQACRDEVEIRDKKSALAVQVREQRQTLSELQSQLHGLDIEAKALEQARAALSERMLEEHQIDLAAAAEKMAVVPLENREAAQAEIEQLRGKLSSIGGVNLDALNELDDLEQRFGRISQQYHDLVDAKATLQRIIARIATDSRQLFLDTLATVREHFQELFRRLFGGGEADILLEQDSDDPLESGIEIVACPPGKQTRAISLLSGGEKTLTCVALLLAVFRSKPSPFCVLDEVDAALDEANIDRFVNVLREFLSATQFVVVTHSKKTMAGADTLYGVTMQESGVSKQVSVRFDDVTEDGHILPRPAAHTDAPSERRAA